MAGPVTLSLIVAAGAALPAAPLAFLGHVALDARFALHQPLDYVLLAPATRTLDELTLLTGDQHRALLLSVALLAAAWSLDRAIRQQHARLAARLATAARCMGLCATGALAVYLAGAVLPRPMVSLRGASPDDILVDFHSHTDLSHDGRWRFDADANRAWHSEAGFHAAYVTDHQTIATTQGLAGRGPVGGATGEVLLAGLVPAPAAPAATVLLPGIETVVPGAHVNLLGVDQAHAPLFRHPRNLDTVAFAASAPASPLVLLTLPFDLDRRSSSAPRLEAIEISNGSPRGLAFGRTHRARIQALADSLGIPVVAASNAHGWGATAVAWTAMRIPGWTRLSAEGLDRQIRVSLQRSGTPVAVIERTSVATDGWPVALALTLPGFVIHIWRVLTPLERLSFVGWAWAVWLARRRRTIGRLRLASG